MMYPRLPLEVAVAGMDITPAFGAAALLVLARPLSVLVRVAVAWLLDRGSSEEYRRRAAERLVPSRWAPPSTGFKRVTCHVTRRCFDGGAHGDVR